MLKVLLNGLVARHKIDQRSQEMANPSCASDSCGQNNFHAKGFERIFEVGPEKNVSEMNYALSQQ